MRQEVTQIGNPESTSDRRISEMATDSSNDKLDNWKHALDQLANVYADVDRRSFTVPGFSLAPLWIYLWASCKLGVCLDLDLFLFVPMNCVIAVRNIFPGKWAYRSFSAKYFMAAFRWIRNGETPLPASIVVRSLTAALLSWHFNGRLSSVRRRVIIEDGLDPNGRTLLIAEIDRLLLQWPAPNLVHGFFAYGLPVVSPLAALYQTLVPGAPAVWTRLVIIISLSYALTLIASAFMVKRGLMLGGEGRASYFPGFLEGSGAYAVEQEGLARFGLLIKEFPLAYSFTLLLIPVQILQTLYWYESGLFSFYFRAEAAMNRTTFVAGSTAVPVALAVLGLIALVRQRKLGRS